VPEPLPVRRIDHVGVRVADAARSEAFYAKLGFEAVWRGGPEPVVILRNAAGVEINLIVNADPAHDGHNALMDAPPKRAGWTHVALGIDDVDRAVEALAALGVELSGGPVRLGDGRSIFVRDPDRNVIELRGPA
jgi:lactoylglutathione lyase